MGYNRWGARRALQKCIARKPQRLQSERSITRRPCQRRLLSLLRLHFQPQEICRKRRYVWKANSGVVMVRILSNPLLYLGARGSAGAQIRSPLLPFCCRCYQLCTGRAASADIIRCLVNNLHIHEDDEGIALHLHLHLHLWIGSDRIGGQDVWEHTVPSSCLLSKA